MEADLGAAEDELDTSEAPIDGGAGAGPETVTADPIGGAGNDATTDQTV